VVRSRVVIAAPDGPAVGFTPRHSRSLTAVTNLTSMTVLGEQNSEFEWRKR
jgi:hypothetical protein